jgi:MoaA/NifB/PqqE/SkfB family radical SAM enzyme
MINEFSPFNRWKGLFHIKEMEAIAAGQFLPPYWVATDPSNKCNQNCRYCNTSMFRRREVSVMPGHHLLRLADFYRDWGIKSTIIEGGGEPLMGENVPEFIKRLSMYDIQSGLITNGVFMGEEYAALLPECARWIGISFDASTPETYRLIRGTDHFWIVLDNIKRLCKNRGTLDVRMKFLIQPENYPEIISFVKLAKELGCSGAQVKPLSLEGVEGKAPDTRDIPLPMITALMEEARALQTPNFAVDCVTYKHDDNYKRIVKFKHCKCTPLGGVFAASGTFWLCYNMRGREGMALCRHMPDPWEVKRVWGTAYHKGLIETIDPAKCMRCGLTQYNEMIENCIEQDKLYRNFP